MKSPITLFQENLLLIRRAVGWTAGEMGDKIGVTRQTINNLESGRTTISKTQYIALRSVLDAEMQLHPEETEMLHLILDAYVDHPDEYEPEKKAALMSQLNMVTPSILASTSTRAEVSKSVMDTARKIGGFAFLKAALTSAWILMLLSDSDKEK